MPEIIEFLFTFPGNGDKSNREDANLQELRPVPVVDDNDPTVRDEGMFNLHTLLNVVYRSYHLLELKTNWELGQPI